MPYKDPEKRKEYARQHYLDNTERYQTRNRDLRKTREAFVKRLKEEGSCADCGGKYLPCQMQYDHLGSDKVASISDLVRKGTMLQILAEIEKCELVCANCHALRTWKRKCGEPV